MSESANSGDGWFKRLRAGLGRSSQRLTLGISEVFASRRLDDSALEDLEDLLIMSDLGVETARKITEAMRSRRFQGEVDPLTVRRALAEEVATIMGVSARPLIVDLDLLPHVVLVVGVNGSGKTTTIGKMATQYRHEDWTVTLAAGDTFRAAAVEQLKIWGERADAPVIARDTGADAAGLAFDAYAQAKAAGSEVLLIDTAGRLQNKDTLMAELQKVVRVLKKHDPAIPHDVLLVLDATVGQNAIQQVEVFRQMVNVTGLVMTKLDGTAKGGVLVGLADRFGLPIHYIGVGEGAWDMRAFTAEQFAHSLLDLE